jgi:peroxiredoxin Q/BCP
MAGKKKKKSGAKVKSKTKPKVKAKRPVKAKAKPAPKKKPKTKAKAAPKKTAKAKPVKAAAPKTAAPAPTAAPRSLPSIDVVTTNGGKLNLTSLKGKNVVVYFYPKDDTPGCTTEGCDIRDRFGDFQRTDTVVLGVSRDSLESHEKFKAKFGFPFELISDPDEKLCKTFGVIKEKSLYGKTYLGIDRSTFVFDKSGALRKEYRGVQVAGHADELLSEINKF